MAIAVEMPKMSDTMEEGVLVEWLVEEGSEVSAGDVIAQVETDKATMDLEVYDDGVLLKQVIQAGDAVPIGGLIAVLGEEGEDVSEVLSQYGGGSGATSESAAESSEADSEAEADTESEAETEPDKRAGKEADEDSDEESDHDADRETDEQAAQAAQGGKKKGRKAGDEETKESGKGARTRQPSPGGDGARGQAAPGSRERAPAARGGDGRIKSSPLARKMASDHGIELRHIAGSGPKGRIIKRDVEAAIEGGGARQAPEYGLPPELYEGGAEEGYETEKISQMRKTISRRLSQSKFGSPHFYLTVDVDMEEAVASRGRINALAEEEGVKISYNDLITKACAVALRRHPHVNASYLEEEGEIRRYNHVHVAVAVAIDEGLVTPVIRHADRKGLARIAAETQDLAHRARERKLQPEDWEGSTFTTSNLGMFGIEEFTAIINPPNSCILAIGAIRDVPVVKDGAVVPGKRMKLTLSCDHRLVDGATGAEFLATVRSFLEEPLAMLM